MTSIDELFKKPLSTNKRQLEVQNNANALSKASKLSPGSDVSTTGHATVTDEADQEDTEAGPELPPGEDEPSIDEDGRFFGGGVTSNTANVLDYIDKRELEDTGPERIDIPWLRKMALSFEKRISKNAELRAKYEATPQKFMSSEADLDADIKSLSILSEHPDLYEEFVKLGCVASLVSLLSHENTDIAIDAIELINELTDEDVDAQQDQWDGLVDAMLEADILNLLYENIKRMDEELESDRSGIFYILNVLENLSSRPVIVRDVGKETEFIQWLLSRMKVKEPQVTQNKQYAAEILVILLQSSPDNRSKFVALDGIDTCLQLLSPYRKRDPSKGTEEEELMENLFDCLTVCVDDAEGKKKLLEAEGIELCAIMLREGNASQPRALRLLDHSLGGTDGGRCCEVLVEAAGLKTIFKLYKKKQGKDSTEHLLGILASMLRSLPANSESRIRLLAKFEEKHWRIIENLVQTRREVYSTIGLIDRDIEKEQQNLSAEDQENMADEWLSRRLDAGLYTLQTVDTILAWLVAEDEGAKKLVIDTLADRGEGLEVIKKTLQDQLDTIDAGEKDEDLVGKDMIATLVSFLGPETF